MTIQKFPLVAVQQVRQHIQNALATDVERQSQAWVELDEAEEAPEPTSIDDLNSIFTFGGLSSEEISVPQSQAHWSISTVNPGAALLQLPGLQLKPGWRLISYLYREGGSSVGLVFAIPEEQATTAQLEQALASSKGLKQPPQPAGSITNFMQVIEGDRSVISFIVASLLWRELREFGASGVYRRWSHHRLINRVPTQIKWRWNSELPKDLAPKAKVLPNGQAIVEFFTCRVSSGVAIYRHVDQYPVTQYSLKQIDKPIAVVQPSSKGGKEL